MKETEVLLPSYSDDQVIHNTWPADELEAVAICPVCHSPGRRLLYQDLWDSTALVAPGYWSLWRCDGCRCAYLDPRPTPDSIGKAYEEYYTHAGEIGPLEDEFGRTGNFRSTLANGYRNWRFGTNTQPSSGLGKVLGRWLPFLRRSSDHKCRFLPLTHDSNPKVLDLGCGDGRWLAQMARTRWEVHGADPDPKAVSRARSRGVDVRQGGVEAWADMRNSFHAITMSHVIEHVHDPRELLTRSFELLKPGGQLYVETPNIDALGHSSFKRSWRGLEPPRHLILFNGDSLVGLLREIGFHKIKQRIIPSPLDFIIAASSELRMREKERFSHGADTGAIKRWIRFRSKWTRRRAEFLAITCERS